VKMPTVLLIGRTEMDFSLVRQHLQNQGCNCRFVPSYSEGVALLGQVRFDLILSSGQPGIRALVSTIVGSATSLFCAHAVEDSCLWVPVVLNGDECLGLPPLHPNEFTERIGAIIKDIRRPSTCAVGAAE
jgi:hypothetical protein